MDPHSNNRTMRRTDALGIGFIRPYLDIRTGSSATRFSFEL